MSDLISQVSLIIQLFFSHENPVYLIFLLWSFVNWIWGAIVLSRTRAAKDECEDIWQFCCVSVILTAILASLGGIIGLLLEQSQRRKVYVASFVSWLITLIWGCGIWFAIDSDCRTFYKNTYPSLWIYYTMITISSTILVCLSWVIAITIKLAQGPLDIN